MNRSLSQPGVVRINPIFSTPKRSLGHARDPDRKDRSVLTPVADQIAGILNDLGLDPGTEKQP